MSRKGKTSGNGPKLPPSSRIGKPERLSQGRRPLIPLAEMLEDRILLANSLVVTSLADSGPGTLRALLSQEANGSSANISFAPGLSGTIDLATPLVINNETINILGPGSHSISISNQNNTGILFVTGNGVLGEVNDLTLIDSNSADIAKTPGAVTVGPTTGSSTQLTLNFINDVFETLGSPATSTDRHDTINIQSGSAYEVVQFFGSTFLGNSPQGSTISSDGVEIADAELFVDSSTFENFSNAIVCEGSSGLGRLDIFESTFVGNSSNGEGSVIKADPSIPVIIEVSAFTDNKAAGGIIDAGSQTNLASIEDSIVFGNQSTISGNILTGDYFSDGFNDFDSDVTNNGSGSARFPGGLLSTDLIGVDPHFAGLGDYGGSTPTDALEPNSPVLHAGEPFTSIDQRGYPRSSIGGQSIGPYDGSGVLFTVTSTGDNGGGDPAPDSSFNNLSGTLRQAIVDANSFNVGTMAIQFDIAGAGGTPQTIPLQAALDSITAPVVIDGTTEPGYAGSPIIRIESGSGSVTTGLTLDPLAVQSSILGLNFDGFSGEAIDVESSKPVIIAGNVFGPDSAFASPLANGIGVYLTSASSVTIGGTTEDDHNLFTGDTSYGIYIDSLSSNNVVEGNFLGTGADGSSATSNPTLLSEIAVLGNSNTIGGTISAGGVIANIPNVIGGATASGSSGISLAGDSNTILGNDVGVGIDGVSAVPNYIGINVSGSGNLVGSLFENGHVIGHGNLIENSAFAGVFDTGGGNLEGNTIESNAGLGIEILNTFINIGVTEDFPSDAPLGQGNTITGNGGIGLLMVGADTNGSNVDGNTFTNNGPAAIRLSSGALNIFIGDTFSGFIGSTFVRAGNVITGNGTGHGVEINGSDTSDNFLNDNFISGFQDGVVIDGDASNNGLLFNTITGNTQDGVDILGAATQSNEVSDNTISNNPNFGVYVTGPSNSIGEDFFGDPGNAIYGNGTAGSGPVPYVGGNIDLDGPMADGNTVTDNLVGYNPSNPTSSAGVGIEVSNGASNNTISDNTSSLNSLAPGVLLTGSGTGGNLVEFNFIGTNPTGTSPFSNQIGVEIADGASGNTLTGNVISGNTDEGVDITGSGTTGNIIAANTIGTDGTGTVAMPNMNGVLIEDGATGNTIGGTTSDDRNIISGNTNNGVKITDTGTNGNVVEGNYIGTDVNGISAIANGTNGVFVELGATNNTIGGTDPGTGNVISGNTGDGVALFSGGNTVEGNLIGTDESGANPLGNLNMGIELDNSNSNTIGGNLAGAGNVISDNLYGLFIQASSDNLIAGNMIGTDSTGTIAVGNLNYGLLIFSGSNGNTIGGITTAERNLISANDTGGLYFQNANSNVVVGNYFGTTSSGTQRLGTGLQSTDIIIQFGVGNRIGTDADGNNDAEEANVIAGAGLAGIAIGGAGTTGNVVEGNFIGTDKSGTIALENLVGVMVDNGATNNTIGGTTAAARNIISGNTQDGIETTDTGTTGNIVEGNYIGTDVNGTVALPNGNGIVIENGSTDNTIGGTTSAQRNVISGNSNTALQIQGTGSSGNVVERNYIGVDATGDAALGNFFGIQISGSGNTIGGTASGAGNIIAGNDGTGSFPAGSQIVFAGNPGFLGDDNAIEGNFIGLDANGQALAGATGAGILFDELTAGDTTGNTIGGTVAGARNVISGNNDGLLMAGDNGNLVEGNYIGTDPTGTIAIGNGVGFSDVELQGAVDDTIGGTTAAARNIISGAADGVIIENLNAFDNLVEGNYIGTDVTGKLALANFIGVFINDSRGDNTIGGPTSSPGTGAGNLIAGNSSAGININGDNGDVIEGNAIGIVDLADGGTALGNTQGIELGNTTVVTIGGPSALDANIISGNSEYGISVSIGRNNFIQGNLIGTNATGMGAVPNGVGINVGFADGNTIGGTTAAERNVISGNSGDGVAISDSSGNIVEGNYIGTDIIGAHAVPNALGVVIEDASTGNTVGGSVAGSTNVISGNTGDGIEIDNGSAILVAGNLIGTDSTGQSAVPNLLGVQIDNNSTDNTVGGTSAQARNVMSGNLEYGIEINATGSSGNVVEGNYIGVDVTGNAALGNTDGILLFASANTIGGTVAGARNIIAGNDGTGFIFNGVQILVAGNPGLASDDNVIEGNYIGLGASGHALAGATNGGIVFDVLTAGETTGNTIGGTIDGARNVISGNLGGIGLEGDSGNLVEGNFIGTDPTGMIAIGNGGGGDVDINQGSSDDTIGGTTAGARNIISGDSTPSGGAGLGIDLATGLVVEGNYIGTDVTGTVALPNAYGIKFGQAINSNDTIGGATSTPGTGAGNLIAGNNNDGINFFASTGLVMIEGNAIGIVALPGGVGKSPGNGLDGIGVFSSTNSGAQIGGPSAQDTNVISGNGSDGIDIDDSSAVLVEGDLIGTDITDTASVPNAVGVMIDNGSTNNTIGGSLAVPTVISGNGVGLVITDPGTDGNLVEDARIGTNAGGSVAVGNLGSGVIIEAGASNNTIGSGPAHIDLVIVSGNKKNGIEVDGSTSNGNVITGVLIGLAIDGRTVLANSGAGISNQSASHTTIVGNTISGNAEDGIVSLGTGSPDLVIASNLIGTSVDGGLAIGNGDYGVLLMGSTGATIGGLSAQAGNTISGSTVVDPGSGYGIELQANSIGTVIEGNVIGGLPGFGSAAGGIRDQGVAVTIGGAGTNDSNLIAYNDGPGIYLGETAAEVSSVTRNRIAGNSGLGIAIDFSGDSRYPSQNFETTPALNIPGGQLNAPEITSATILSGFMTITGFARPGSVIEFDAASADATGFGQGAFYLGTFTQGSAEDFDAGQPLVSYSSPIYGSDTGAAQFQFTFAIPSNIVPGMAITSVSEETTGVHSVSEFGVNNKSVATIVTLGPILFAGANATILVGQTYSFRGTFGDNSSDTVIATVNYGDSSLTMPLTLDPINALQPTDDEYSPTVTGFYELSHVYLKAGTYTVLVNMLDDGGLSSTTTLTVTVEPAPIVIDNNGISLSPASDPTNTSTPAIVPVDQSVLLQGRFTDVNPGATQTVSVIWGDGSQSFATVDPVHQTFSATHAYTAPSSDVGKQGLFPVAVLITDSIGESTSTTEGLFYAEVLDTPPSHVVAVTSTATVAPGGTELLSASFNAPQDKGDLYHVVVDWGDGSTPTKFDLIEGETSFPALSHTYLAKPLFQAGTPDTITVSVTDPFEPLAPATGTASVSILPALSSSLTIRTDKSTINEGDSVSLSGTLIAAVPSDPHNLTINWGNGRSSQVDLPAGVSTFSGVVNPYPLNSLGQPGGDYAITAAAIDPTRPDLTPTLGATFVTVRDLAPTVSSLALATIEGVPLTSTLENSTVVLTGRYTNPGGVLDQDTVMINWGDGTTSPAAVDTEQHTFTAQHAFGANPDMELQFLETITATVTDSEGISGSATTSLNVIHAAPTVAIGSAGFSVVTGQPILTTPFFPGNTYTWTVDGSVASTSTASSNFTLPTVMLGDDFSALVSVTAKDSYGVSAIYSAEVHLVNDGGSTYQVPLTSGVNAIVVFALAGGKTIEGNAEATTPIIFDGIGAETFIGDNGPDVFNLHADGALAFAVGDHNTFMLTPNCTLTAVAEPGSIDNTLDFSTATYGVTFDLQEADGPSSNVTPQNVDAADPSADHIVATNDMGDPAAFTTLVCSSMGDNITASTGSTIVGGGGMDSVNLKSVTNVNIDASTKGNQITATGSDVGNINFNGDANASATGDVNFLNMGSVTGPVSFFGDQGSTTFNNFSSVSSTAMIAFTGDQGSTTFNNTVNALATGMIAFTGDQNSATFNNAAGTLSQGIIAFTGDQGSNTFNNGPIAIAIAFTGDQGSATFGNGPATTGATISFSGDLGSNTFNNGPGASQTGSINFTGDQGSATFNNGVLSGTTTISFTGDLNSTMFGNGVNTGQIVFTGDQGSATFNNGPGASQTGSISFNGDQGSATFNNGSASGSATIVFTGDQGSATFNNPGTISSGPISFTGDGGSATYNNGPGASQTGAISFTGDQGSATFNNGAVAIAIAFTGDLGSATFGTGTATTSGAIVFSGDQGSATFNNGPGASQTGSINFTGDQGSATFNNGVLSGTTTISFAGDLNSTMFGNGVNTGQIVFTGDQGSATFNNGPGASQTGSISFNGDQSSATFNNGSAAGSATIVFTGDQGSATFSNPGTISSGPISFTGDGGSATFNNGPGASQTGMIVFTGDQSSNTFNNGPGAIQSGSISFLGDQEGSGQGAGTGDQNSNTFNNGPGAISTGSIVFTGDQTSATFNNAPGASQAGAISFQGDQSSSTFNNSPGAMQTGAISFQGDHSSNTFINGASSSGLISFTGNDNAELLWNQGAFTSGLTFEGSGGAVSSTLVNTGTIGGNVTFTGNAGSDAFYNGAIVNGTLLAGTVDGNVTFFGGTGSGTLVNDGNVSGSFTFQDGASSIASIESLVNLAEVKGTITFNGDGGTDSLDNSGSVGKGLVFNAGSGTNTLVNTSTAVVDSISFTGIPESQLLHPAGSPAVPMPANQVLNQENGLASINYHGGDGGNLLVNTGVSVGSMTFQAFGDDSVLENSGDGFGSITFDGSDGRSSLINTGNSAAGDSSTIKYFVQSDPATSNDTLENSGVGLASINMSSGEGTDLLVNIGDGIGQIAFDGGDLGGTLLNSGSGIGSIDDTAGGGSEVFRNDGTKVGSLAFKGNDGTDYFLNNGSTSSLTYLSGSAGDTVVNAGALIDFQGSPTNPSPVSSMLVVGGAGALALFNAPGGTISGFTIVGTSGAFSFENGGTMVDSTIDATPSASGTFTNDLGGTLTNVTYKSSAAGDTVTNFGSISGFTFVGGAGPGLLNLYGPENVGITYMGGTAGDTLVIGTDARDVSGISFDGNDGPDLLASDASDISDVTLNAGLGTATLWSLGAGASGLTLVGGSGLAILDNTGEGATGLVLQAGAGGGTLNNTGDHFGSISLVGGSSTNALINSGDGGSSIELIGGSGSNSLTNTGNNVVLISLIDGAGINGADSADNSGNTVGSIVMTTNAGVTDLINSGSGIGSITDTSNGGMPSVTNSGGVGSLVFNGGSGDASLVDSGAGPTATISFTGGGPDDVFDDSATAQTVSFNAMRGSGQVVIENGATGTITLVEGTGANDYLFSGTPQVAVTIQPATVSGPINNTLDFSTYFGGGLVLDLMKTTLQAIAGGMTLTLTSPEEISGVVGTQFSNSVFGNLLADTLDSTALPEPTTPGSSPATSTTQWAYLDFTTFADPVAGRPVHVYTPAEEQTILQTIEADYWGPGGSAHPWFNVAFTTSLSQIPASLVSSGDYATLYFNRTSITGEPGGDASEIDFGNLDPAGFADIQVNGLLGGDGEPPLTTANFDTLSAKIAAHEFAHLLGVRHSDAFGPIGFGIHTPPGSSEFNPVSSDPDAAFETDDHIISSPATQGTDRFNDLRPLDFGPREAIKIAFGEQGTITPTTGGDHSMTTAMSFPLTPLSVPNTDVILPDIEQGMNLQVVAGAVAGAIGLNPTTGLAAPDWYSFTGKKGDDFTFETESQELPALGNGGAVDTIISVYDGSGNLVPYYGGVAVNDDQFEGTDSLLDDVILPATGTYYVKVTSFTAPAGDPLYDPTDPASPLNPADTDSILNPANPSFDPAARAAYIAAGNGQATGQYNLFIYRESQSDPTTLNVNNMLVARGGGSTLASSGQGDTLVGGAGTDSFLVGSDTLTISSSSTAPVVDLNASNLFGVTISDTEGKASWPVTINYGDGTAVTTTQAEGGVPLELSHHYASTGSYTVTISYLVGGSDVEMTVPITMVATQAPSPAITAVPTAPIAINTPTSFSATLQSPYVGDPYTATWTFTNQGTGQKIVVSQTVETLTPTTSLPFTLSESFASAGSYTVQLSVTDTHNGKSTPAVGTPAFTVASAVATTITGSVSGLVFGLPTTFTATVKAGSGTPTGSVDFFDTTTGIDLGSAMLSGSGVATLTPTVTLPAEPQTITLTYAGSGNMKGSSVTVAANVAASIFVLNTTASGALSLSGSASITVPGTVQVNSSSTSAILLSGATKVSASTIGVVGGTSVSGSAGFSVKPTKNGGIADPYAHLPIPSATGMKTFAAVNLGGVSTSTISPGIYPSISVGGSAKLTLQPGIYVITGGGFSVSGAGIMTGSGVLIYNAGNNFNGGSGSAFGAISLNAGTVHLTPPTSGVYAGVSFFQSKDNTKTMTVSGSVDAQFGGGAVYAPSALLQITGSGEIGGSGQPSSPLVVNELLLSGAAQATPNVLVAKSSGTSTITASSSGSASSQILVAANSVAIPLATAAVTPNPSTTPGAIDSALASLYPTTPTSPLSSGNVQQIDDAIDAVVQESYLVPVEIAQDVQEPMTSDAGTSSVRKSSNALGA
jgi:Periplasmic copper-binding protein (NosD)/Right handed beta helix region